MANKKSKAQAANKKKMSKAAAGSARKAGKKAGAAEVVSESPVRAYQAHRKEMPNGTSTGAARNTASKAVRQLEREPISTSAEYEKSRRLKRKKI